MAPINQRVNIKADGRQRILDIKATELHQRVPLFIGCRDDVAKVAAILQGKQFETN